MNENQLETFLAISEYKSYSKAAEALNVTQPTVSSRIKALEEILQCTLFTRVGHDISLTEEGILFSEYAEDILVSMQRAKEIKNLVKSPIIRVGFSPGYSYSFIIKILKAVKSIGNIDVQIIDAYDSVNLNNKLITGKIDLVFTRDNLFGNPHIISEFLFDNQLVVVLPINHHLSEKTTLDMRDLHHETIFSYKRESTLWKLIDNQLIRSENTTRVDVENNEMLLNAIANELGIGIIPELGIDDKYNSQIVIKNMSELDQIANKVYVHYRKNAQIEKMAKQIIYAVIEHKYYGK